jgi:NAD(P)-dependent dehydrogenase (short-subunit alcohol dehydrogenase family)
VDLSGSTAVVTGAGSGIGKAIAQRFVAAGARVAVNDLDAAAAQTAADELGASAIPGDAASESGVNGLIDAATSELGQIDIYVANAGIGTTHGLNASEVEWAQSWDVNVMAHVRAARRLIPAWTERGSGRFVVTASAAGLLTMLGDAPYSVTKHGAVAFAEWLSATYGSQGIDVHAICPLAVNTPMYENSGPLKPVLDRDPVLDPPAVADALMEAITNGRFFVLPHPQAADYYAFRAADPDRWLKGMRKIQSSLPEN